MAQMMGAAGPKMREGRGWEIFEHMMKWLTKCLGSGLWLMLTRAHSQINHDPKM